MKSKIKKLLDNYYLLSFILGALFYYMFLSYSQLAGGKYVILEGDGLDAYAANMKAFCDNILNGKGILYSWSISLGANGFLAIPAFSLTNIIYLLLYKFDVSTVTIITLVLKSGVVSLFFYLYISKIWKIEGVRALIFSILYALCAYQVAYMPVLIGYVDTIFMLPLLLYACSIFADKCNIKILCFAYLYSFINYYYTAYMLVFFTLIYLCLYMLII